MAGGNEPPEYKYSSSTLESFFSRVRNANNVAGSSSQNDKNGNF